jgi:hypothetical protein
MFKVCEGLHKNIIRDKDMRTEVGIEYKNIRKQREVGETSAEKWVQFVFLNKM